MEKESLYHLVYQTTRTFSERPCYWVRLEKQEFAAVSYSSWRADMKRFQAYMIFELGLDHGDAVGLLCDNRYEWNLISLGLSTIGCVDVPRMRRYRAGYPVYPQPYGMLRLDRRE